MKVKLAILFAILFAFGCAETKTQKKPYPKLSPEQRVKAEAEYPDDLPQAKPDKLTLEAAKELTTTVQAIVEELEESEGTLDRIVESLETASGNENPKKVWTGLFIINFNHGDTPDVVILFPTRNNIWVLLESGIKLNTPKETMSNNGLEWTFLIQDQDKKVTGKKILVRNGRAYVVLRINNCEITVHTVPQEFHFDFAPCVKGVCGNFYSTSLKRVANINGDCKGIAEPVY